jgi:3',5'-cyclic AMP phosphodiesterase CpdA
MLRSTSLSTADRFKFAFFASNGLNASKQSPQARNVLEQIKSGAFPLVLGGGGYALSTEAIASGAVATTSAAVAAWKQQASVVTANSIFSPVLGDTEVESYAHGERASDYAEFMTRATPNLSYSFNFNGAHFVAVHAPGLGSVHPGTAAGAAQLAWIESDLAAARAARARWIVVYMHTDLFSSERSDAVTTTVRQALGAILQRYGVNLVLSGEGNSYERSRALRGGLENPIAGPLTDKVTTATDGIVFVRAGSGGRTAFGSWLSSTRPSWSASRNNTRPVYLSLTADGTAMGVVAYGLDASGKRTVIDAVEIR